ncbi:MAG: PASTA domain-containing protein, partial [Paludibacteraceae bacterium]|nr:PASTA domain-containing protein [Paludibacteraceae bacterium]
MKIDFLKNEKAILVAKNIAYVAVICVLILVIVQISLRIYTHHGDEVLTPTVTSLYVEEAENLLRSKNLRIKVMDSTYLSSFPLGMIVDQDPPANSHIKENRTIYVIVNAKSRRKVALPNLYDYSLRQAQATLTSMSLQVGEIMYEKSEYKDLILGMQIGERRVEPGLQVPEGTTINLVVGTGRASQNIRVPNIKGKKINSAVQILRHAGLTVGTCLDESGDEIELDTKQNLYVFWQRPESGTVVQPYTEIDIKVSNRAVTTTSSKKQEDEDFF